MSELTIDKELIKIVFDVAVESMDFGSGFLDDEEVEALRKMAVILGLDPAVGTPDNFKCKYGYHRYSDRDYPSPWEPTNIKKGECFGCRKTSSSV